MFVTSGTRLRASEVIEVEEELLLPFEASSELIDISSAAATRRFLAGLALFIVIRPGFRYIALILNVCIHLYERLLSPRSRRLDRIESLAIVFSAEIPTFGGEE